MTKKEKALKIIEHRLDDTITEVVLCRNLANKWELAE